MKGIVLAATLIASSFAANAEYVPIDIDFSTVTNVGREGFSHAFTGCAPRDGLMDFHGVRSVESNAFESAFGPGVTNVDLSGVERIGRYGLADMFDGCPNPIELDMPNLRIIGQYGFKGNTNIVGIAMTNLDEIGDYAFTGCTGLHGDLVVNATNIAILAFYGIGPVKSFKFPRIGNYPGANYSHVPGFVGNTNVCDVEFGYNFTNAYISYPAFNGCTELTNVTFRNLQYISGGGDAFYDCPKLKVLNFPDLIDVSGANLYMLAWDYIEEIHVDGMLETDCYYNWKGEPESKIADLSSRDMKVLTYANMRRIGDYGFYNGARYAIDLHTVDFGNVTNVGHHAFASAFGGTNLGRFDVPRLKTVGFNAFEGAFVGCTNLTDVDFGAIGVIPNLTFGDAFRGCRNLRNANFGSVVKIGNNSFKGAFYNCNSLTNIDFHSVKEIGDYAFTYGGDGRPWYYTFNGCTNLVSISFDNATNIGHFAFNSSFSTSYDGCEVKTLSFQNAERIGTSAFDGCSRIESIRLPKVNVIPEGAFGYCYNLSEIELDYENITEIEGYAFAGTKIDDLSVFENVTNVDYSTFEDCNCINEISMPNLVTVGEYSFGLCTNVTSVSLPELKYIRHYGREDYVGECSFMGLNKITDINLPKLTELGNGMFYGCSSLTNAYLPSVTTIRDGFDIFYGGDEYEDWDFSAPHMKSVTLGMTRADVLNHKDYPFGITNSVGCVIHCTDGDITIEK